MYEAICAISLHYFCF